MDDQLALKMFSSTVLQNYTDLNLRRRTETSDAMTLSLFPLYKRIHQANNRQESVIPSSPSSNL
jgi:hypothetical protein